MRQVKAQVMCRDDGSGGWVPVAGGGLSIVALRQCISTDREELTYKITGHRQTDSVVSISYPAWLSDIICFVFSYSS